MQTADHTLESLQQVVIKNPEDTELLHNFRSLAATVWFLYDCLEADTED